MYVYANARSIHGNYSTTYEYCTVKYVERCTACEGAHFAGEVDLDELAEATAIVVAQRFRVAERLQQRVRCKHESTMERDWTGNARRGAEQQGTHVQLVQCC